GKRPREGGHSTFDGTTDEYTSSRMCSCKSGGTVRLAFPTPCATIPHLLGHRREEHEEPSNGGGRGDCRGFAQRLRYYLQPRRRHLPPGRGAEGLRRGGKGFESSGWDGRPAGNALRRSERHAGAVGSDPGGSGPELRRGHPDPADYHLHPGEKGKRQ